MVAPAARQPRLMAPVLVVIGMLYCTDPTVTELPQAMDEPERHSVISKLTVVPEVTWTIKGYGLAIGQVVCGLDFMQPATLVRLLPYTSTLKLPKTVPSLQLAALADRQRTGWLAAMVPSYRARG